LRKFHPRAHARCQDGAASAGSPVAARFYRFRKCAEGDAMTSRSVLLFAAILSLPGAAGSSYAANTPAAQTAAVATTDGESPGTRLDVQELKRVSGDALMLKFTVHNDGSAELSGNTFHEKAYNSADGVYLVDLSGKKKYSVVTDASGNCLCSRDIPSIASHTSAVLWAKFPAPPADVTKIGVVVPHFIPMDDVPLSH
jgi:hypothetical protein